MKTKSLQIGKAMSAALFVLLLMVAGTKNVLAQTQVATLQHGDEMTAFYGMNALVEAHAAAVDGDIITLSSGTFTKTDITKTITLHGAGCTADTLGNTPTIVAGSFSISGLSDSYYLDIEGISFGDITYYNTLYHVKFRKCNVNTISNGGTYQSAATMKDVQFVNCLIGSAEIRSSNDNVSIINCVIGSLKHIGRSYGSIYSTSTYVYNSIIGMKRTGDYYSHNGNLYLYNCIVSENNTGNERGQLYESTAYNCIEIDSVFTSSVQTYNCMSVNSYSEVFESFDGTFSFDTDYSLKEEIATSFLGNDGREVGIYGGVMPYDPRPSYLILSRYNVANRSTIDGKLSVEIEVITNE